MTRSIAPLLVFLACALGCAPESPSGGGDAPDPHQPEQQDQDQDRVEDHDPEQHKTGGASGDTASGPITIPKNATTAQVQAAFARILQRRKAQNRPRPIGGGDGPKRVRRLDILGAEVLLVSDRPMPDAGDPIRHGAFVERQWVGASGLRSAIFRALGYAEAEPERKVEIAKAWGAALLASRKGPEVETLDGGKVRLRVHIQSNYGVGGFPMTNQHETYVFNADGSVVSHDVEPVERGK